MVDFENLKRGSAVAASSALEKPASIPGSKNPPLVIAAVGLLVLALAGLGIYLAKRAGQPAETGAIDSIAVLPLVNASNDANMDYLSDGITESIINSLSQLPNLRVVPRVAVFRHKGREIDPQKLGRELGVRAVLTGKVVQLGDRLSIQTD